MIFKVGGCEGSMSDARSQSFHGKSVLLVALFLLSIASPLVPPPGSVDVFDGNEIPVMAAPFSLASGYGHDFAGTSVSVDGLDNALVREESMFDYWIATELNNSSVENHGTPDMALTRTDREHYCWSTEEGPVRTAIHRPNGAWSTSLVDTVAAANTSTLVDCAIAVTANELPRVLYADGGDLKMGRYARESATYWNGSRWHTRTVLENVNPTHLELELTPSGVEWGVMRTDDGALHQVNFSGAYWTVYLLDAGPVGTDIELSMDDNGTAHLLYTRTDASEVVLMRVTGMERDVRILERNADVVDGVGMDLDAAAVEQVATATQTGSTFSINLIRSLAGQDAGRVNPVPTDLREGVQDEPEGSVLLADFNGDGYDDLAVATPTADVVGFTDNGRVDVYHGSASGLSATPETILAGDNDQAHFGLGMDVGDFNGDGVEDLAVGSPGWHPTGQSDALNGQVKVYLGGASGIQTTSWWTVNGSLNESLGAVLTTLMNASSPDGLAAAAHGYRLDITENEALTGKVNLFAGGTAGMVHQRNLTPSKEGPMFGRSMEGCDVNGDGFDELIVGNTGTFEDSLGYSSVEYFYGNASGYAGTPDHTLESLSQGRLLGHSIVCAGDLNADGLNEHLLTEPFNTTTGVFGTGVLWLYDGTESHLPAEPDWQYFPTIANQKVGEAIAPAGDINEDGYDDLFISSRMGSLAGRLEIFLGSADGLRADKQLLADGNASERLAFRLASNGDINGDGLSDIVYSHRNLQRGTAFALDYEVLSEQDWESISFENTGTITSLDLATAARGETSMVFVHNNSLRTYVSKLEHMNDGTPSGQWVLQTVERTSESNVSVNFAVRSSGQPLVLVEDDSAFTLHTTTSMTAVEQEVATTGTMGQYIGSNVNENNEQVLAYTSGSGNQIYAAEQTASGWSTDLVRTNAQLAHGIEVLFDTSSTPRLVYRHDTTDQLEMAVGGGSWSLTPLGNAGDALSTQHPAVMLDNGTLAVALIASNGTASNLVVWMHDGTTLSEQVIANASDLQSHLALTTLSNGSLVVASLTTTGSLGLYEQWPGNTAWQSHNVLQPSGTTGEYRLDLEGGDAPVLAVRGNAVSSLLMPNATGVWTAVAERPAAAHDGAWDVLVVDDHLLLLTSDESTHQLTVNTLELSQVQTGYSPWMSVKFGDVTVRHAVSAQRDSNGTVHMAYWDEGDNDALLIRLYADQDRDLVFDLMDEMPLVGDQWADGDGDNFGDNPLGPLADQCPTAAGVSSFVVFGCADYDTDGFADSIDGCDSQGGTSWIDRFGCEDLDQDGWSDNGATYYDGDVYKGNWKQALDTDGDGFGDNHGVDCCTTVLDPNAGPGDLFPYLASQYADYDGDGYGDNDTDAVHGDFCPWDYGDSWRDRNGCLDTDGDGASDPSGEGTFFEWNVSQGADVWPLDATQWSDTDGDGFGDNQSENATLPDRFPQRIVAANDTDGDGFPNNWTAFASLDDDGDGVINLDDRCVDSDASLAVDADGCDTEQLANTSFPRTSYRAGLELDQCPDEWGNSSVPVKGCLDSDGDGYTDQYSFTLNQSSGLREGQTGDAFPFIKSQILDTDGDGFGDNLVGELGDACPFEAGVLNGTNGVGCRIIDLNDDDDDGVINDLDTLCPNSPSGETVNAEGCAPSELDDDDDGVKNNADLCSNSPSGTPVDGDGCTTEQRETDSDGDGFNDPVDLCPDTEVGAEVDENGCSQGQRDSDGDGLSDLEDACDDTPPGFPILANGCTDESALTVDLDGDGYAGVYTYDIDNETGLHVNQSGDAFPSDPTQWFDTDGDGLGDNWGIASWNNSRNPAWPGMFVQGAQQADFCSAEAGNSSIDLPGCYDDGDGYADFMEPEKLRNNPTQWSDADFDGFGDNWGDPSWTPHRDGDWPGVFVEGATNADLCPTTLPGLLGQLDDDGCHPSERDSDYDGVKDDSDNCPNDPKGVDGYDDGCPYVPLSGDGEEGLFGVDAGTLMVVVGGGLLGLLVLVLVVRLALRGGNDEDDDEDDYDDFFDDDEDEGGSFLDQLDAKRAAPSRAAPSRNRGPSSSPASSANGPRGGPGKAGPGGPPKRGPGGPPQRSAGGPPRKPGGPPRQSTAEPTPKVAKKKSVTAVDESPSAKVRKAKIQVDLTIFEDWQADDRASAVDWVVGAFADGEEERGVLMQLQETGWTAEQSRAICNLAKNKGA